MADGLGQFHVEEKYPVIEDKIPDGVSITGTLVLSGGRPSNLIVKEVPEALAARAYPFQKPQARF